MNDTTRMHPRTLEQAFGPASWPITGPFSRPRRQLGALLTLATVLAFLALCAVVGVQLVRAGGA